MVKGLMIEPVISLQTCGATSVFVKYGSGKPSVRTRSTGHYNPAGQENLGVLECWARYRSE